MFWRITIRRWRMCYWPRSVTDHGLGRRPNNRHFAVFTNVYPIIYLFKPREREESPTTPDKTRQHPTTSFKRIGIGEHETRVKRRHFIYVERRITSELLPILWVRRRHDTVLTGLDIFCSSWMAVTIFHVGYPVSGGAIRTRVDDLLLLTHVLSSCRFWREVAQQNGCLAVRCWRLLRDEKLPTGVL